MSDYTLRSRATSQGGKLLLSKDTTWKSESSILSKSVSNESLYSRSNEGPPFVTPSDFYHTKEEVSISPFLVSRKTHKTNGTTELTNLCYGLVPADKFDYRSYSSAGWSYTDYFLKAGSAKDLLLSESAMMAYGLKGLNRMNPLRPKASMTQSIVELKRDMPKLTSDVIKRLLESRKILGKRTLKAGSQDYLNFQFGIKPLMSDIQSILKAAISAQKDWDRFVRLNGKWVSRKTTLERSSDVQRIITSNGVTPGATYLGGTYSNGITIDNSLSPSFERTITTETHVYATCQYRYYYPEIERNNAQKALYNLRRIGLDFNPAILWELMPWSFLIDWFVNCGDLIEFWTNKANDSLMYRNLAVMASKTVTTTYQMNLLGTSETWDSIPGVGVPHPPSTYRGSSTATVKREAKQRYVGNDFGFGTTPDSLNAFQKSILLALYGNTLGRKS